MTGVANVYSIPAGWPFAETLAEGVLHRYGAADGVLTRVTIIVPTRRAVATVRDAFVRAGGGTVRLLPAIRAISDSAEDDVDFALHDPAIAEAVLTGPQPIRPLHRRLLLMELIRKWSEQNRGSFPPIDAARAFELAAELGHLLDDCITESVDLEVLDTIVPERFSAHWKLSLDLLTVVKDAWPTLLGSLGYEEAAARRDRLLRLFAQRLESADDPGPYIVAGSTGSIPAAAELYGVISRLPEGAVVLPGLDQDLDAVSWAALPPDHPQDGLKRLLDRLEVARADVGTWQGAAPPAHPAHLDARRRLISEVMRPAETTDGWARLAADHERADDLRAGLSGISVIEAPDQRAEAMAICLVLREQLEIPGRTAALVTPDRTLARRVQELLKRWEIGTDDSGGRPLTKTAPGAFLLLVAETIAQNFAPVPLLALLKHPLATAGGSQAAFRAEVRRLERTALRGPRPRGGLDGLADVLAARREALDLRIAEAEETDDGLVAKREALETCEALIARLKRLFAPTRDLPPGSDVTLTAFVTGVIKTAEALAASEDEPGYDRLWRDEAGTAAQSFFDALAQPAAPGLPLPISTIPGLLRRMMDGVSVRRAFGGHPRLAILGAPEARIQQADVLVLGGLNEGSWPALPETDAWLNRPMRREAGLSPPEKQIGKTAHDFAQAACAPRVFLTRAAKVDGAPKVASRWLHRLDNLVEGVLGREVRQSVLHGETGHLAWALAMDIPAAGSVRPITRPAPTPPLAARPTRLSVTDVEHWLRDPYHVYAKHVLRLRPLDPVDADPGASERGEIIHQVLDRFTRAHPDALPETALEALLQVGRRMFHRLEVFPGIHAFWWQRFERAAEAFITWEESRRAEGYRPLATECFGALEVDGLTLTGVADRIDRHGDGAVIVDYKTGAPPNANQVARGLAPQLPLEAAMLQAGAFEAAGPLTPIALDYVKLSGGDPPLEHKPIATREVDDPEKTAARLGQKELFRLKRRIRQFAAEDRPYTSQLFPKPGFPGDYDHLARVKEWAAADSEEGDA